MTAGEEQVKDTTASARDAADATGAADAQKAGAVRALESTTPNSYEELAADELAARVAACKEQGFRFIQMCATTADDGVELLYSFSDPDPHVRDIVSFILRVEDGACVPSISGDYPEAFVNENEAHDLFGVRFEGLSLDYEGKFYTLPVSYPMNPRAAQAQASAEACVKPGADTGCGEGASAGAGGEETGKGEAAGADAGREEGGNE